MRRSIKNNTVRYGRPPPHKKGEVMERGESCSTLQSFHAGKEGGSKQDWEIRPNVLQTFQEEGLISATHYYSAKIPH